MKAPSLQLKQLQPKDGLNLKQDDTCWCFDGVTGLAGEVCTVQGASDCTNPTGHGTYISIAPDYTGELLTVRERWYHRSRVFRAP